jgi:hypothetical protein
VRRRALFAAAAAVVVWLVVANNLPAQQGPAADWSRLRSIESGGIRVYYPRAWHATADGITIVVSSPSTWIWLANYGPAHGEEFPPRPERFELRDEDFGFQSCGFGFEGWNLGFTDHGQVVQAVIRQYPGMRESDAAELLDRLEIS